MLVHNDKICTVEEYVEISSRDKFVDGKIYMSNSPSIEKYNTLGNTFYDLLDENKIFVNDEGYHSDDTIKSGVFQKLNINLNDISIIMPRK